MGIARVKGGNDMESRKATKASVYFRHGCWNHRYAKIYDNGQKEYGSVTGFDTEEEANESFWKYLDEYRSKLKELQENAEALQQSYYDEDLDDLEDYSEEDYDEGGEEDEDDE